MGIQTHSNTHRHTDTHGWVLYIDEDTDFTYMQVGANVRRHGHTNMSSLLYIELNTRVLCRKSLEEKCYSGFGFLQKLSICSFVVLRRREH